MIVFNPGTFIKIDEDMSGGSVTFVNIDCIETMIIDEDCPYCPKGTTEKRVFDIGIVTKRGREVTGMIDEEYWNKIKNSKGE